MSIPPVSHERARRATDANAVVVIRGWVGAERAVLVPAATALVDMDLTPGKR
jgi:hypothetical protein